VEQRGPEPLLKGRDVLELGLAPGPRVGRVLAEVFEAQLDGAVASREQALTVAGRIVERELAAARGEEQR
jgi:hypothetical protein